jgi:hypothetical protein
MTSAETKNKVERPSGGMYTFIKESKERVNTDTRGVFMGV